MKGQPSRKNSKYLHLHCRGKCECFRVVLWSGRVAHKVTFFSDFPELVPIVLLWWGWVLSRAHGPLPSFLRLVVSCVLVCQLHCSFIPWGPSLHCSLSPLTKSTKACGCETPSYEYNCRVINDVYINYPVKADVQLHWCESQKHHSSNWEYFFPYWRAGNFATLSGFHKFTFVLSGKRVKGKLQVLSVLLKW